MTAGLVDDDHADVVAFLSDPATYAGGGQPVQRFDTHGAIIFIAGDEAWKIKRPVRFPYMDLSTLEKRHAVCLRETEINRIWAPELYLGTVAITRQADGALALDGDGKPVEWAVRMRSFSQDHLLARIAETQGADGIKSELARDLADVAFDAHTKAARHADVQGAERMAGLIDQVAGELASLVPHVAKDAVAAFEAAARRHLADVSRLLDARAAAGFMRRCHGDMHLGNIILWHGRPMLFDAIEFDEDIATVDTLYDLAFLLMDLDHRGLRRAANVVLNRYLWRSADGDDIDGLKALPLFLALRAGVRAMVAAERAAQADAETGRQKQAEARGYLNAAEGYLNPSKPVLIAVAGLSGTGKSTLAARLAPEIGATPGAVHLRSDLERKSMFGVGETERLNAEAYTPDVAAQVYHRLIDKARRAIKAGRSVIIDAVSARPHERAQLEVLGAELGVPLRGLWLTADADNLMRRVAARRNDASDATTDVVLKQLDYRIGDLSSAWQVVDAGGDLHRTAKLARDALGLEETPAVAN